VQVHRYEQNNPGGRSERRILPWKIKAFSGMEYESEIAYETDKTVSLGTMSYKCVYLHYIIILISFMVIQFI